MNHYPKTLPANTALYTTAFSVEFILFWLFAAGTQLYDFNAFKGEMNNQVFSAKLSSVLVFAVPSTEIIIAALLIYPLTRLAGMTLSFLLMLVFTVYVGLALLEIYSRMPCNCAGLLGSGSTWGSNFLLNLFVTAFALTGLIFTYKRRGKEENGMHNNVMHAPLTA